MPLSSQTPFGWSAPPPSRRRPRRFSRSSTTSTNGSSGRLGRRKDPAIQRAYSDAAKGVGAVYEWNGNKRIGQGRMEIVTSEPPSKVSLKIDFFRPMEGHNQIDFVITQSGGVSTLTHAMHGPSPYLSRLMTIFFSMDKMIGAKFEEGLASLKTIAEK